VSVKPVAIQLYPEKVFIFSSNYGLYHNLSQRVMTTLEELTPVLNSTALMKCSST